MVSRNVTSLAVALGVLLAGAPPARADTVVVVRGDNTCSLAASGSGGTQSGTVEARVTFPPPYQTAAGTVTCTVQTGTNDTHAEVDAASATSAPGTGAAVLPPTPVTYAAAGGEPVYLCTRLDITGGPTLHWSSALGVWAASPDVDCDLTISVEAPGTQPVALCPADRTTAQIDYAAPPGTVAAPTAWTITVSAECSGSPALAGHYDLTLTGTGVESCTTGSGATTVVSGTGPDGTAVSGSWAFTREHAVVYDGLRVPGTLTYRGVSYPMRWWLFLSPGTTCPAASQSLDGFGALGA